LFLIIDLQYPQPIRKTRTVSCIAIRLVGTSSPALPSLDTAAPGYSAPLPPGSDTHLATEEACEAMDADDRRKSRSKSGKGAQSGGAARAAPIAEG
jgi:hypothetical protein